MRVPAQRGSMRRMVVALFSTAGAVFMQIGPMFGLPGQLATTVNYTQQHPDALDMSGAPFCDYDYSRCVSGGTVRIPRQARAHHLWRMRAEHARQCPLWGGALLYAQRGSVAHFCGARIV